MTWIEHHRESERLAGEAEIAAREGEIVRAQNLYRQAAQDEECALHALEPTKARTLGISAVSAVSLYYKGRQFVQAESLAYRCLVSEHLPEFAHEQLRGLLQSIWSERVREHAGVDFAPGHVIVSVRGGEVVEGGAPLDLIVEKVQTVQSLYYRTAEFLRGLPHRKRGGPIKEIQESCRPWLFQAAPTSYQFAVAIQEPRQTDLFRTDESRPEEIAHLFLRILRASVESPEEKLPELVPALDYRGTFLKLTRNLAPTGKRFGQLDVRSASETRTVSLLPGTRSAISQVIRTSRPATPTDTEAEEVVRGVLRALHLDNDWIEVTVGDEHLRIDQVGETVDDVIGPMVNRPVLVNVVRDAQGRRHFHDIETDD